MISILNRKNIIKTIEWYDKSIELSEDSVDKADLNLKIASILSKLGNKSLSRNRAYKAIDMDRSRYSEAYNIIGILYMSSPCKDSNPVKAKANYLLAYDMFQKANNMENMKKARSQFLALKKYILSI